MSTAPAGKGELVAQLILYFAAAGVIGALPGLVTNDLDWCYPFMSADSWDWLVNGLFWTGAPVAATFRPPGLPLVIALLHSLSVLPLLPFLNFAMLGFAAILLHRFIRLRHSPLVAALAIFIFLSNGSLFGHTRFVMAEVWTLPFLVAAAIAFVRAADRPQSYLTCALLLSLSFLFHYAGAIVGVGLAVATLVHRRAALANRWPWLALLVAAPLPGIWIVVRALHGRSSETVHPVEGLLHLSFENVRYFAVVSVALLGLAALPLYLAGAIRLLPSRETGLSPWGQAVLYPLFALALFFTLVYDWADKRFLYYLFPFAVAVAAEGLSALGRFARTGRLRALCAATMLAAALLWNRIPYPPLTHSLLALTPRNFLDAAQGIRTAQMQSLSTRWNLDLLISDGFFAFEPPPRTCALAAEAAAISDLQRFIDPRLAPGAPIAWASPATDPAIYWLETNRLIFALERPIVKPGEARFVLRPFATPDPRALAIFGPFELFDLQAIAASASVATGAAR